MTDKRLFKRIVFLFLGGQRIFPVGDNGYFFDKLKC